MNQANKAAFKEQLEIDLEQQALKVVNQASSIKAGSASKKSKQLVSVNLLDFVKPDTRSDSQSESRTSRKVTLNPKSTLNPLDSSAPTVKRGKERETPKSKKPSPLKKVILKEREERKKQRYVTEGVVEIASTPNSSINFPSDTDEEEEQECGEEGEEGGPAHEVEEVNADSDEVGEENIPLNVLEDFGASAQGMSVCISLSQSLFF